MPPSPLQQPLLKKQGLTDEDLKLYRFTVYVPYNPATTVLVVNYMGQRLLHDWTQLGLRSLKVIRFTYNGYVGYTLFYC